MGSPRFIPGSATQLIAQLTNLYADHFSGTSTDPASTGRCKDHTALFSV